jgi:hypothetical protein
MEHAAAVMRTEAVVEAARAQAEARRLPDYDALSPNDLQNRVAQALRTAANTDRIVEQ